MITMTREQIQTELDNIAVEMAREPMLRPVSQRYAELYSAQQALSWVIGIGAAPLAVVLGTHVPDPLTSSEPALPDAPAGAPER